MACRGLQPPVPRMERVQRMKARLVRSIGAVASRLSVSLITIAARSDGVDSAKPSPASTPRSAERPVTRNAAQVMLLLLTGLFAALVLVAQRVCSLRRLVEGLGWAASVAVIALLVPACQCSPSSEEGDDDDRSDEPRVITEVPEGAVFYLGDHQHSPVVLTNARGEVIRAAAYDPYGSVRHENGDRTDPFAYVGNEHDSGAELADFKARPYRPKAGIFLASDPVAVFAPEKLLKEPSRFAPYTYAGGNPTDRSDASGKLWDVVLDAAFIGYDVGTIVAENVIGRTTENLKQNLVALALDVGCAALPLATGAGLAYRASKAAPKVAGEGAEVVQRAMSRAELAATRETGLIRGGREGTHYVADAVNSTATRAQSRLALPVRPEVRATLEVPPGRFSAPSRVRPLQVAPGKVLPGGGTERIATGPIPARVIRVDKL
jgi:RHS repeat-associated protein